MFTYKSLSRKLRLFFCITPTQSVPYLKFDGQLIDSISECKVRKIVLVVEQIIVGLPAISSKRVYTIPYQNYVGQYIKRVIGKVKASNNVLFVDQDIQFLQTGEYIYTYKRERSKCVPFLRTTLHLLTLQNRTNLESSVISNRSILGSSTIALTTGL